MQFRREYSLVIRDIMDGDGTGDRARAQNMNKDQYIEKFVKAPQFTNLGELTVFLENEYNVRDFLLSSMKETMARSRETVSAGANVALPQWKIDQVKLPAFRDKFEFFDYFEKRGFPGMAEPSERPPGGKAQRLCDLVEIPPGKRSHSPGPHKDYRVPGIG